MKPRRSILSVPGHVEKMHVKANGSEADGVLLDLEDSVPTEAKETARSHIIRALKDLDWRDRSISVRCNGLDTPYGYKDIVEIGEKVGFAIDSFVIPKVHHPGDIHCVHRLLDGIEMQVGSDNSIGIEATIESVQGLENVAAIAGSSKRLASLIFGIADFSASMGVRLASISGHGEGEEDIYPGHRWHFVMSRIAVAAKAHGLAAIDSPYGNFRDADGLRRSAALSNALGYDGKWVIHPDQIGIVNEVFSPALEDIARARKILSAYEAALQSGRGAVAVEGRMVDHATVRLAKRLVAMAKHLNLS